MRKLVFPDVETGRGKAVVRLLYKVFVSDKKTSIERVNIKQMARIAEKVDEVVMTVEDKNTGMVHIEVKPEVIKSDNTVVITFETADFDSLLAVLKRYEVSNAEAMLINSLYDVFEKAEDLDAKTV